VGIPIIVLAALLAPTSLGPYRLGYSPGIAPGVIVFAVRQLVGLANLGP
jgi:hypothetical protein